MSDIRAQVLKDWPDHEFGRYDTERAVALEAARVTLDAVEAMIRRTYALSSDSADYEDALLEHLAEVQAMRLSLSAPTTQTKEHEDLGSSGSTEVPARSHGGVMSHSSSYERETLDRLVELMQSSGLDPQDTDTFKHVLEDWARWRRDVVALSIKAEAWDRMQSAPTGLMTGWDHHEWQTPEHKARVALSAPPEGAETGPKTTKNEEIMESCRDTPVPETADGGVGRHSSLYDLLDDAGAVMAFVEFRGEARACPDCGGRPHMEGCRLQRLLSTITELSQSEAEQRTLRVWTRLGATIEQARRLAAIPTYDLDRAACDQALREGRASNMWPCALQMLDEGLHVVADDMFYGFCVESPEGAETLLSLRDLANMADQVTAISGVTGAEARAVIADGAETTQDKADLNRVTTQCAREIRRLEKEINRLRAAEGAQTPADRPHDTPEDG